MGRDRSGDAVRPARVAGFTNKLAVLVLVLALLVAALYLLVPRLIDPLGSVHTGTVTIASSTGPVEVFVEVADEPLERARGLMFRESLAEGSGMLFVFPDERAQTFWMKDTFIPLDLIFIGGDLTVVDIVEGAVPCQADPCPLYTSGAPARYALEVNADFVRNHGINVGADVVIDA